jgi:hypothetical protein
MRNLIDSLLSYLLHRVLLRQFLTFATLLLVSLPLLFIP